MEMFLFQNLNSIPFRPNMSNKYKSHKVSFIHYRRVIWLRQACTKTVSKYSKKPLRMKIKNRFFYLHPNSNYFGRLVQKIFSIGQFRAKLLSTSSGLHLDSPLLKTCPRRLNYLLVKRLNLILHKNFLSDQSALRFVKRRIKQKMKSGTVYNVRALRGLPVRGQRNKTNSRSARSYFKKLKLATSN